MSRIIILCTCKLELVPPTAAPFSFEMDVVLVGVASFFFLHPLIFMLMCVCLCICLFVCVCVCVFVCASALSCNGES